jgi:hypothetical protein
VPLGAGNIIQTAKGDIGILQPALSATTAGTTVFVVLHTDDQATGIVGFTLDRVQATGGDTYLAIHRQTDMAAGETSWTVIGAYTVGAWVAYEVSGLYPDVDTYTFNSDPAQVTTETLDTNAFTPSDADVFVLTAWAAVDPSGITAPTWASYTNSYTESQEQAVNDGTRSLDLATAHKFPASTAPHSVTATLTVSGGHTASTGCIVLVFRSTADPLIFLTGFSPGTAVSANIGTTPYIPLIVGSPAVVADAAFASGYCAEITTTAATGGYGLNSTVRVSGADVDVGHARVKLPSPLPAGDVVLVTFAGDTADHAIRFRASDGALVAGRADGTGTPAVGPVVAGGGVYRLEWRFTYSAFTIEWRVDGVAQPTYGILTGGVIVNVYIGPATVAATVAGLRIGDWCDSVTAADYPLGDVKVVPLTVDPAGTVTLTGTAGNWLTYTLNGTTAAWDATVARNNIDEVPFVFGASNDGVVQATASTTDHVDVPLTSYTVALGEIVMGARLVVLGWAVSGTAATVGFRYYNGSVEEILVAGTVNPAFSNSTTAPGWFAKMLTLANINTQGKLDASVIRNGYASDATPDIGWAAELIEVAIRAAQPGGKWHGLPHGTRRLVAVTQAATW